MIVFLLRNHHRSKVKGIALLELMLATAILGIALVALGIAVSRCVRGLSAAARVQIALDLAKSRFSEWKTSVLEEDEIQPGVYDGAQEINHRRFEWRQEIESTDDPDLLKMTLIIHWREGGLEQQRSFVSLIPKSFKNLPKVQK